ncbi:hypothetical protein AJ79_01352 [Helicocarpus griseus UAMH5409]|uniref:Uncharacterized protein n=1 Tax=Helicocarpus griseus UAMH5409 TaxID=1447875 RepID=A0A2B7Y7S0_9EURO|nr:hypothetical protein AJ79_01352 [Helicocarpus griseus UAMH5409]
MSSANQNTKRQQQPPTPQYSDEEDDYFSGDDYSEDDYSGDDYSVEEYQTPAKNQPQKTAQAPTKEKDQEQDGQMRRPMNTSRGGADEKAMQPFERIGPPSTSMDGPVTYARAQRGEIPMRDGNPNQKLQTAEKPKEEEQDGLKLKLELNLDIEVELKASIHGDLTLALL